MSRKKAKVTRSREKPDASVRAADAPPVDLDDRDHRALEKTYARAPGVLGWFASTNHKDIGMRYIVTSFAFFLMGGVLALFMRLQLMRPNGQVLGPDLYNQFFTTHGTTMMFLFAVPVMEGLALYLVPLMLGTREVAFPKLMAFGYWVYLISGLLLYTSLC